MLESHEYLEDDLGDLGQQVYLLHDLLVAFLELLLLILFSVDVKDGLHKLLVVDQFFEGLTGGN